PLPPSPPPSTLFPYTTLFRSHFHINQRGKFTIKKRSAVSNLFRRRLVLRRSAAYCSRNVGINKFEPVFAADSRRLGGKSRLVQEDRKSTRLNSSHDQISYAVF